MPAARLLLRLAVVTALAVSGTVAQPPACTAPSVACGGVCCASCDVATGGCTSPPAAPPPAESTSKYWGFAALAVAGVIAFYVYIKCCGGSNGGGDEEGETGVAPATRCCLRRRGPRGKRAGTTGDASEAPAGATLAVRGLSTRAAPPTMDSVAPPSRAVAAGHPVRPRGRAQLREGHMRIDPRTHRALCRPTWIIPSA